MALEAEQYLEKRSNETRMYRQVQQMPSGSNHSRQFVNSVSQRNVLERTRRHHEIERLIRKRKTQQITLRERDIALPAWTVVKRFASGHDGGLRQIESRYRDGKTYRAQ
jgi:hypothetical protein